MLGHSQKNADEVQGKRCAYTGQSELVQLQFFPKQRGDWFAPMRWDK
jgi:hypothetical protein